MKYIRIPFNARFLFENMGIDTELFKQMLDKFPQDAKIIGFGNDPTCMINYVFVSSDSFRDVPDGHAPPEAQVFFRKFPDDSVICESVDFPKSATGGACIHDWVDYHGIMDSYKFCKKCNKKESQ